MGTLGRATVWRNACVGAPTRFGWNERDAQPRSCRDGDWLIGHGMAAAAYPIALFMPAQQRACPDLRRRQRRRGDGNA